MFMYRSLGMKSPTSQLVTRSSGLLTITNCKDPGTPSLTTRWGFIDTSCLLKVDQAAIACLYGCRNGLLAVALACNVIHCDRLTLHCLCTNESAFHCLVSHRCTLALACPSSISVHKYVVARALELDMCQSMPDQRL